MNKPTKRVERKSLFQRGPQAINGERDPNFEYRFVNDTGVESTISKRLAMN